MLRRSLLFAVVLSVKLVAGQAQSLRLPSPLPGHEAESWRRLVPALPGGAVIAPAATAPIPTVGAAVAYPPLTAPTQRFDQPLPAAAPPLAPRRGLTGIGAAPAYDPYQNWPEAQRKYILPAVWAEPLPLQLLRSALGR